jgi:hypothetical protein
MKIIVLNFEDCSVELSSRGKVCRAYGEKANGEDVPLYEYDEKKRVIFAHSEIGPVEVEADIGPKKAKQWFLEATCVILKKRTVRVGCSSIVHRPCGKSLLKSMLLFLQSHLMSPNLKQ